jgi:cytochrome c556
VNSRGELMLGKINWSVTAILAIGWVVLVGALAQDAVVQRRRQMESNNSVVAEALNKAVKEKNFVEIENKCNVIQDNMNKVLDFFPRGSLSKNSRAKPEIWAQWSEFTKHPAIVTKAAQELAAAAKAGDVALVEDKFKALGEACKACHSSFRAPKPMVEEEFR